MTNHDLSLLGDAMLRNLFSNSKRLHRITSWWHWIALVTSCIGILAFVIWMYRRDSVEIRSGMAFTLLLLRVFALAGILVTFLNLEKRTERKVVRNSRVVVLIDTSQSMGFRTSKRRRQLFSNPITHAECDQRISRWHLDSFTS